MSSASSQDKERRINLSVTRLIAQVAPPPNDISDDQQRERLNWYTSQVKTHLQEYVSLGLFPPLLAFRHSPTDRSVETLHRLLLPM